MSGYLELIISDLLNIASFINYNLFLSNRLILGYSKSAV